MYDDTMARRRSGVLILCTVFLLGGPWMIWTARGEYRAVMARHAALSAAPQVEYGLVGQHSEVRGSGKNRSTHYFVELGLRERHSTAAAGVVVEVSSAAYQAARQGDRWRARIDRGQAVFDPLQTRYEKDRSRNASIIGSLLFFGACALLWLHRSGRLYRAL